MNLTFNYLYTTYYHRVYYTALKVTKDPSLAEDVLQESFVKVYQRVNQIHDVKKVGAWLTTITTRTAIDFLRKQKKVIVLPIEELPLPEKCCTSLRSDVEREVEEKWLEEGVENKVSMLSPKLRTVFQLYYYHYLREEEIAHQLQVSKSAVKSRLHRARHSLKEKMSQEIKRDHHTA